MQGNFIVGFQNDQLRMRIKKEYMIFLRTDRNEFILKFSEAFYKNDIALRKMVLAPPALGGKNHAK